MSFSFGTPSSAPATSGLSAGFNFGANKPATPGFGLSATSQPSTGLFGTPATSAPAFGTAPPAFGTPSAFGQGSTPGFGATATPAFGANSAALAFGTGTTAAFGAASTAPAFGTTTTPAFGTTPGFGGTSTAPAFGSTTTPAFGTAAAAPGFGATTTPAFGANTSGFGTGLGTGTGGLNFGAGSNATANTGLTLGAAVTTSAGLGGLGGFNLSTTSAGLGGGIFGATTTTTSLLGAKFPTASVTGAQPSALGGLGPGLGGLAPYGGNTTTSGDGKTEPPKQTKLPNEISTTIDSFKDFVKKQKSLSSEIMRVSTKPLYKVGRDADAMLRAVLSLSGEVSRARAHSRRLRAAAAAACAAAEAVANSPATAELESTAPPYYVKELISELEQQLIAFRRQMDVADKQMQSSPKLLTEQELTLGIRRMHESLVALAGRLQAVHSQVEEQKEQYLNLRKYVLKDPSNVFETKHSITGLDDILWDTNGSRKRTKSHHSANPTSAVLTDPRAVLGNLSQLAGPTPFSYIGNTMSPFNADTSGRSWQPQSQPLNPLNTSLNTSFAANSSADSFQLQKPPGKRGKQ